MASIALVKNQKAPEFELKDQNGVSHKLTDYKGRWVVLYAYPRDLTPGCTVEAENFTTLLKEFEKLNVQVFGISPDSEAKHSQFCERKALKHTLLSDTDHAVIAAYGAWKPKKFMGREFLGVVRSTWLINPKGVIHEIWSPVQVKGHAQAVLDTVRAAL